MLRRLSLLLGFLATAASAQLDLGTGYMPQSEIDGYLDPFYRVIASGLGQGRFAPGSGGNGFEAGFQAGMVPLPDRDPFTVTTLSALPFFRLRGGARWHGAALMARGLMWSDPRMGDLSAFGIGAAYGLDVRGPWRADLSLGWDRLDFASEYTYEYRGSPLGIFDHDVPGDYTLAEQVIGGALTVSARLGRWVPYLQGGFDWAAGEFEYLYLDPIDDRIHRMRSDLGFPMGRAALGLYWRGFRAEASLGSYLALEAAWSFSR